MYKLIIIAFFGLALVSAIKIAQDENGRKFYLVPLHRERRQATSVDIQGSRATIVHKGTILNNNGAHRVYGGVVGSKQFPANHRSNCWRKSSSTSELECGEFRYQTFRN